MSIEMSRLLQAATFAADKHRDQRRKDIEASPYINHPLAVAGLLADTGSITDIELLIAAVLHDTVEDTATTIDELSERFGESISKLVAEVTDDKSLSKEQRKQLQVENAPHKSDRAKQLKIADKTCNIRDINLESPANWDHERKRQYFVWAERVVDGCRGINAALEQAFDDAISAARERVDSQLSAE